MLATQSTNSVSGQKYSPAWRDKYSCNASTMHQPKLSRTATTATTLRPRCMHCVSTSSRSGIRGTWCDPNLAQSEARLRHDVTPELDRVSIELTSGMYPYGRRASYCMYCTCDLLWHYIILSLIDQFVFISCRRSSVVPFSAQGPSSPNNCLWV